jgi:hypothetical protein
MRRTEWAKRVAVAALAVVVVVALAAAGATVEQRPSPTTTDHPEYDPADTLSDPIDANGTIEFDKRLGGGRGKVLIDDSHSNRFDLDDIAPMVQALTRAGYRVELYTGGDLGTELMQADAYVVINPAVKFGDSDNDAVKRFTDNGGRLVVLAEPTTKAITGGFISTAVGDRESRVTSLVSQYGMSVSTNYLYNQQRNDGNYKRIVVESAPNDELPGVEQGVLYTSASVDGVNAKRVLIAAPGTKSGGTTQLSTRQTVAMRKGNVLVFGDSTFVTTDYHNVGDNEETMAYIVEFLISGEKTGLGSGSPEEPDSENGTATATATAT